MTRRRDRLQGATSIGSEALTSKLGSVLARSWAIVLRRSSAPHPSAHYGVLVTMSGQGAPISSEAVSSRLLTDNPEWFVRSGMELRDRAHIVVRVSTEDPLDLSFLPAGARVHVEIREVFNDELPISGLPEGCHLNVEFPAELHDDLLTVFLRDCRGVVRLDPPADEIRVRADGSMATVEATAGTVIRVGVGFGRGQCILSADGCDIEIAAGVHELRAAGDVTIRSSLMRSVLEKSHGGPRVSMLRVTGDLHLTLGRGVVISSLIGTPTSSGVVTLEEAKAKDGTGIVTVSRIEGVNLQSGGTRYVLRSKSISKTTVQAPFKIELDDNGAADDMTLLPADFEGRDQAAVLSAGPQSVLTQIGGEVALLKVEHVHLTASPTGLVIHQAYETENDKPSWVGLVVSGVTFPRGSAGRRILAKMADAYYFAPATDGVPGSDQTVVAKVRRNRIVNYSHHPDRLRQDAEYTREIARLARDKGAPGSVATHLAWCAYRLRALSATGKVEKGALAAYRTIGYGERPVPAFLTWIFLAMTLTGPILALNGHSFEATLGGLGAWSEEAFRLALGAFAGISWGQTVDRDFAASAEILARVLISVPLVTGTLALRNYVKSGSN